MTQRAAPRVWMAAATEVWMLHSQRLVPVVALLAASLRMAANVEWVRAASSSGVQVFVDAGSLAKDSLGFVGVWTNSVYASSQTAIGIQYAADMTRFVLDCAGARYGIAGGKFLEARANVRRQFDEPVSEIQPIPGASKIDAVVKPVCTEFASGRRYARLGSLYP